MVASSTETFAALTEVVQEYFGIANQSDLAQRLGIKQPQVSNWLKHPGPTKRTWKKLFRHLIAQSARELVWDLGEYVPVEPTRRGSSWSFSADNAAHAAVAARFVAKHALYVFHDSARTALYVGMTNNNLVFEMRQRLAGRPNRSIRAPAKISDCRYGHLTRYVSAYGVSTDAATRNLEALILRIFANNLMNNNSGHFKWVK